MSDDDREYSAPPDLFDACNLFAELATMVRATAAVLVA
jgi:hypothetical protein